MGSTAEPVPTLQQVLAGDMVYAGVAIFLIGAIWAALQAVIFREKKKRSTVPSMAMILGVCSSVAGMALLYVLW